MDKTSPLYVPILIILGIYIIAFSYAIYSEYKQFKNLKESDDLIAFDYNPEKED